jgi:hypothetical protein
MDYRSSRGLFGGSNGHRHPPEGSPDAVERIFLLLFFGAESPTIATRGVLPIPMTQ